MSTPGFFAEASLFKKSKDYHFLKHLEQAEMSINPAQFFADWSMLRHGPVFAFSSDFCPVGQEPVIVKTGGKWGCTKMIEGFCINQGTPFEKCSPSRCIEWGFTPIEYRVECRLKLLQLA